MEFQLLAACVVFAAHLCFEIAMNLLHISDIHFGPYHWAVDDDLVIDRLNAFPADIVFNTGDITSDSFPAEFQEGAEFLAKLTCPNVVSIPGNHDKYSKRSHELFREHIYNGSFVQPKDPKLVKKNKVFINPSSAVLSDYFTEINYTRHFNVDLEIILIVCIDTNLFQKDSGVVEIQILETLKDNISELKFDRALMLTHHSILTTDEDPLSNSKRLSDFLLEMDIEATFCGHTHELDITEVTDLVRGKKYRQFMCGSLSSVNISKEKNMFCTYENFGTESEIITVTRMLPTKNGVEFVESKLAT